MCAHNIICGSMLVCGGVYGSAASKQGQQRTRRSDGGTDVQTGTAFANSGGEGAARSVC